ncbi:MAG: hypothetical protein ACLFT4_09905 [Bacteroidales bacterium]
MAMRRETINFDDIGLVSSPISSVSDDPALNIKLKEGYKIFLYGEGDEDRDIRLYMKVCLDKREEEGDPPLWMEVLRYEFEEFLTLPMIFELDPVGLMSDFKMYVDEIGDMSFYDYTINVVLSAIAKTTDIEIEFNNEYGWAKFTVNLGRGDHSLEISAREAEKFLKIEWDYSD